MSQLVKTGDRLIPPWVLLTFKGNVYHLPQKYVYPEDIRGVCTLMIQEWFITLPWDILGALASILSFLLALVIHRKFLRKKMSQIMQPQISYTYQSVWEFIEKILLVIFRRLFITTLALFVGTFLGGFIAIGIGSGIVVFWMLFFESSSAQKATSIIPFLVSGLVAIVIIIYFIFTTYTDLKDKKDKYKLE